MNRREVTASIKRATTTQDSYGEPISGTAATIETITIAISAINGSTTISNNVKTTQSTNIGVCKSQLVEEGDLIVLDNGTTYRVDFVAAVRRYKVLYLRID